MQSTFQTLFGRTWCVLGDHYHQRNTIQRSNSGAIFVAPDDGLCDKASTCSFVKQAAGYLFFYIFFKPLLCNYIWWRNDDAQELVSSRTFLRRIFFRLISVCFLGRGSLSCSYRVVGHALAGEIAHASVVLGIFVPRASEHAAAVLFTALCAGPRAPRATVCIQTPPET